MIKGVIEGFYGNPWSNSQRIKLFQRMHKINMNTYLYAPKDDLKHRAEWRLLYDQDECDALKKLIKSALDNSIEFVYAISPGLDITYSSEASDFKILLEKLEQVMSLGCRSFAILFDDIDNQMKPIDQKCFSSFAHAQVHVTNCLYERLKAQIRYFFFCPTEYCTKFSIKASKLEIKNENEFKLDSSEYLTTIGNSLNSKIDILWTGPGIVSVEISVEHINEVIGVLKRKPLIWENFHANDYDKDRLFLGPFKSRPIGLRNYLKGIMTNPNCEFECNFNAFYTLSYWFDFEMNDNQVENDKSYENEPEMNEILLEIKTDFKLIDENKSTRNHSSYDARMGLKQSIRNWLQIFYDPTLISNLNKTKSENNFIDSNKDNTQTSQLNQNLMKEAKYNAINSFSFNEESKNADSIMSLTLNEANKIDELELKILCDFFYLPYDYGTYSLFIMNMLKASIKATLKDDSLTCYESFGLFIDYIFPKFNLLKTKLELIPNTQILHELKEYSRLEELTLSLYLAYHFMSLMLNIDNFKENNELKKKFLIENEIDLTKSVEYKRTGGLAKEIKRILSVENLKLANNFTNLNNLRDIKLIENKIERIELIKTFESDFNRLCKPNADFICFGLSSNEKCCLIITSFINKLAQKENFLDNCSNIPNINEKSLIYINFINKDGEILENNESLMISLKLVIAIFISYFKVLNSKGIYLCSNAKVCDFLSKKLSFMELSELNEKKYLYYDFI